METPGEVSRLKGRLSPEMTLTEMRRLPVAKRVSIGTSQRTEMMRAMPSRQDEHNFLEGNCQNSIHYPDMKKVQSRRELPSHGSHTTYMMSAGMEQGRVTDYIPMITSKIMGSGGMTFTDPQEGGGNHAFPNTFMSPKMNVMPGYQHQLLQPQDYHASTYNSYLSKYFTAESSEHVYPPCHYGVQDSKISPKISEDTKSEASDTTAQMQRRKRSMLISFPKKLFQILSQSKYSDFISWLPHGRAFRVLDQQKLEDEVLPRYFRSGRFHSFMRQVNGWGFIRICQGPDINGYYHELFLRGMPHLLDMMKRKTALSAGRGKQPGHAPDFYKISVYAPLPDPDDVRESTAPSLSKRRNVRKDSLDSISTVSMPPFVGESLNCSVMPFLEKEQSRSDEGSLALLELKQSPRSSASPTESAISHTKSSSAPTSPTNELRGIPCADPEHSSKLEVMITPLTRSGRSKCGHTAKETDVSMEPLPITGLQDSGEKSRHSFYSYSLFGCDMSDHGSVPNSCNDIMGDMSGRREELRNSMPLVRGDSLVLEYESEGVIGDAGLWNEDNILGFDQRMSWDQVRGTQSPFQVDSAPIFASLNHVAYMNAPSTNLAIMDGFSSVDMCYLAQQNRMLQMEDHPCGGHYDSHTINQCTR